MTREQVIKSIAVDMKDPHIHTADVLLGKAYGYLEQYTKATGNVVSKEAYSEIEAALTNYFNGASHNATMDNLEEAFK